jgi:hypothetical protein
MQVRSSFSARSNSWLAYLIVPAGVLYFNYGVMVWIRVIIEIIAELNTGIKDDLHLLIFFIELFIKIFIISEYNK